MTNNFKKTKSVKPPRKSLYFDETQLKIFQAINIILKNENKHLDP